MTPSIPRLVNAERGQYPQPPAELPVAWLDSQTTPPNCESHVVTLQSESNQR